MSCGLARRVSPPGGIGRDPEVPDGPRRVAAVLEVIGEEWRRLARLLCERGLCPFGGLPMQPRPAARRDAVVQHLTVERMGKLIERRDRSVWQFLESAWMQNVGAAGQALTDPLELTRIGVHRRRRSRDDRECTMLGQARPPEHPLLVLAETLHLNLDHFAGSLGDGETQLV